MLALFCAINACSVGVVKAVREHARAHPVHDAMAVQEGHRAGDLERRLQHHRRPEPAARVMFALLNELWLALF